MAYMNVPNTVTAQIRSRRGETINLALPPTCTVGDLRSFFINDYRYPQNTFLLYNGDIAADNSYVSEYPYGSLLLATPDDVYGASGGGGGGSSSISVGSNNNNNNYYHGNNSSNYRVGGGGRANAPSSQPPQQQPHYAQPHTSPLQTTVEQLQPRRAAPPQSSPMYRAQAQHDQYTRPVRASLQKSDAATGGDAAYVLPARQQQPHRVGGPRQDANVAAMSRASAHESPVHNALAPPFSSTASAARGASDGVGERAVPASLAAVTHAPVATSATASSPPPPHVTTAATLAAAHGGYDAEAATVRTGSAGRGGHVGNGDGNGSRSGSSSSGSGSSSSGSAGRRVDGAGARAAHGGGGGGGVGGGRGERARNGGSQNSVSVGGAAQSSCGGAATVARTSKRRPTVPDEEALSTSSTSSHSQLPPRPLSSRASSTRSRSSQAQSGVHVASTTAAAVPAESATSPPHSATALSQSSTPRPRASLTIACVVPALRRRVHVHVGGDASIGDLLLAIVAAVPDVAGDATIVHQGKPLPSTLDSRLFNLGIRDDARVYVASGEYSNIDHVVLFELEDEVDEVAAKMAHALTPVERKGYYEMLMRLLFRTDGLQSLEGAWKQRRKDTVRRITDLQDRLQVDAS